MKKMFLTILFAVTIITLLSISGYAANNEVTVNVDGKTVLFDVPPQVINGRTMVPIRAIFEALGANVEWDDSTNTANASIGDYKVSLTLNKNYIVSDGEKIQMDTQAIMINNRILAPARFVAESFMSQVLWDEFDNTVHIFTPYNLNEFYPYSSDVPSLTSYAVCPPLLVGADFNVDNNGSDIYSFSYIFSLEEVYKGLSDGGVFSNYLKSFLDNGWTYDDEKSSSDGLNISYIFYKGGQYANFHADYNEEKSNFLITIVYTTYLSESSNTIVTQQPSGSISKQEITELIESVNLGMEDFTTALEYFNKVLTTSNISQKENWYWVGKVHVDLALLDFERAYKISSKYSETNDATKYLETIIKNLKSIPKDYSNNIDGNLGAVVYALQDLIKVVIPAFSN